MKKYIILFFLAAVVVKANAQDDFQRTAKGTQYKILTHNTGDRIKLSDIVTFNAIQKTDKDSILFSSFKSGAPLQAQIQAEGDLMDVFPLLTVKDSVLIKVPTDSIFKTNEAQRPPFLPKGSNMYFTLSIVKVQALNDAIAERKTLVDKYAAEEAVNANKYIAAHNLVLKTTPTGLKYKITLPSIKRKPLVGDTILVNYTGSTLDGKIFDSSIEAVAKKANLQQDGRKYEPIKIALGTGMVIPGWDEGLQLLNEGSKAEFIIPSTLAYGEKGAGDDIKPFSTLIFDVQLVKVIPIKHAATAKKPGAHKAVAKKSTTTAKKKS
jgi:FKBP-type peptidyl-prolyl cis-trans isomerase FkpA